MPEFRRLMVESFGVDVGDDSATLNITRTWAHHPELMVAQRPLQNYLMRTSKKLPARERELAILRIGWRCGSEYEFGQHTIFGKRAGLTDEEIRRVTSGPTDPGWSEFEVVLLTAVDELYEQHRISDATWLRLRDRYDAAALIEFVSLVGRYWTVSVLLNTVGVALEPGTPGFPSAESLPGGQFER